MQLTLSICFNFFNFFNSFNSSAESNSPTSLDPVTRPGHNPARSERGVWLEGLCAAVRNEFRIGDRAVLPALLPVVQDPHGCNRSRTDSA